MKEFIKKNYILFLVAFISAAGLCVLSYLTILDYSYTTEEQFISSCNTGLIEELESSLKFGKSLKSYYGIHELLVQGAGILSEGSVIVLEDEDGVHLAASFEGSELMVPESEYGEVRQDIHGPRGEVMGKLVTYYRLDTVRLSLQDAGLRSALGSFGIFIILVAVCLIAGAGGVLSDRKLIGMIVAGIFVQGIFLTVNYIPRFEDAARGSVTSVAAYIRNSLNSLEERGIHLAEISDLEEYLEGKAQENSSIDDISLRPVEKTGEDPNEIIINVEGEENSIVLVFHISRSYVRSNVINMVLLFMATIILAIIVMRESLTLSEMIAFRRSGKFNTVCPEQFASVAKALRYGNFLSVTFDYICLSFSALQIREWNQGLWGLSPAMAAALSISICSLADILGMLCMPWIGKHLKGKTLMLASALILFFSNFTCFFTTSTFVMVLMRFFSGIGTAGVKQVRHTIISRGYESEGQRADNLTASNNGVIGGLLCGMGLGSVIAGVFGYGATFLVAAIGDMIYLIFESACIPWELLEKHQAEVMIEKAVGNLAERLGGVLRSLRVWRVLFMIVAPQYFLLMIIVCLIPARIQAMELPGVVLTYSNILNGLAGLYLGEVLYNKLSRRISNPLRLYSLILFMGALSMFVLELPFIYVAMIIVSSVLSGLVDGIGTPVATDIFMANRSVLENLDDTESLMMYSIIGSGVMAIAPFILEQCGSSAVWMYGVCGVLVLFGVLLFKRRKKKKG